MQRRGRIALRWRAHSSPSHDPTGETRDPLQAGRQIWQDGARTESLPKYSKKRLRRTTNPATSSAFDTEQTAAWLVLHPPPSALTEDAKQNSTMSKKADFECPWPN